MHIWQENLKALGGAAVLLLAFTLPWVCYAALCLNGGAAVTAAADVELTSADSPPLVALTFDDGPSSVITPALLDGLAHRGVHATFFLVGSMADNNHDLVRRMADEGHQIGVHIYDHSLPHGLAGLTEAQFRAQVDTTKELITSLTGQTDFALRPPYGYVDDNVRRWAEGPIILWSVDPEDWRDQNAQRVADHIVTHAADGAIILLHDLFPTTVEGALEAVDRLLAQGYRFVTVDELFSARDLEPADGQVYRCLEPQTADS